MVPSFARVVRCLLIAVLAAAALPAVAGAAGPRWAYVSNLSGSTLSPIDVFTGTLGAPLTTQSPRGSAITPDGSTAYVVNQFANTVTPIDLQSGTSGTPIPVGSQPLTIAIAPDGATAYVANHSSANVTPIDIATNTTAPAIAIGGSATDVAVTPDGATVYALNNSGGAVTPIDTATGTAGAPIPVGASPFGIAITPDGATAYVANSGSDNVTPIDTATNTAGPPIPAGDFPTGVAITPDGAAAYVTNFQSNSVTPIATATGTAGAPIPAGTSTAAIGVSPDGATVYATNANSDNVTSIDTATKTAVATIPVGNNPWGVAFTPNQAPHAAFGSTPGVAGSATDFDAAGSTDSDGTVASYEWDFGDGHTETTTSAAVQHTYTDPGTYTATLTLTDDEGCSDELVFTGKTASCNGSGVARVQHEVSVPAHTPPVEPATPAQTTESAAPTQTAEPAQAVRRFALTSRCVRPTRAGLVRVGMRLRLERRGPVRVQVQRAVGTGAMKSCPKPNRGRRFAGRLRGMELRRSVAPRVVTAAFRGQVTVRLRLDPGLYRITVRGYSGGGELTQPAHRWLRVLGR